MWGQIAAAAIPAVMSYLGQRDTNKENVGLGDKQMEFQERMSNTSYQRAVKDMEAAGLNPMLAYSQGGASVPSGSLPQVANKLGAAVSGAQQGAATAAQLEQVQQTKANTDLIAAQAAEVRSRTVDNAIHSARALAESQVAGVEAWLREGTKAWAARRAMAEGDTAEFEARRLEKTFASDVEQRKAESRAAQLGLKRMESEAGFWETDAGKALPWLRPILDIVGAFGDAFSGISSARRAPVVVRGNPHTDASGWNKRK